MALSVVGAQSPAGVPRYEVKRATAPITIDGKLDEAGWVAAPAVTLQFLWVSQPRAKQIARDAYSGTRRVSTSGSKLMRRRSPPSTAA